jgi:hypothetical protein
MSLKTRVFEKIHKRIVEKIDHFLNSLDPYDYFEEWGDLSNREMDEIFYKIQKFREKIDRLKF